MEYKGFNVPNEIIDEYVEKLGCSILEACDAYLCDNEKGVNQEQEKLNAGACKTSSFVQAGTGPRKNRGKRSRNQIKIDIILKLFASICEIATSATITNPEKYIDFELNNEKYTINLIKHRKI